MKRILSFLILVVPACAFSQTKDYSNDTKTIASTITALYEVISGEPGELRDWDRFRNLFKPESRLIPTRKDEQGGLIIRSMKPEEYIELFSSRVSTGFFERELSSKTEEYGTISHVFSTYETKEKKDGPITNRGINSIQLFKDKDRYYVLNIFWCSESMGFSLPKKYLSNKK